jgi:ribosome-interacting GTPase 1
MLRKSPDNKGEEVLRSELKQKISKYKKLLEKEKTQRKGKGLSYSVKKEGAAQISLIGLTNSGKSLLLSKLTNAKPLIASYKFTTKKPTVGIINYNGIKLQLIEIPAITKNYIEKGKGAAFLSIVRLADLILILIRKQPDLDIILNELKENGIKFNGLIINNSEEEIKKTLKFNIKKDDIDLLKKEIWKRLNLIYVYTKTPGKKRDFPPVALKKGSTVEDLAAVVHKDFIRKFKFARIWGTSAKFPSQQVGLNHKIAEEDTVEFHMK